MAFAHALHQHGAGTQNDLAIAQIQLSSKAVNSENTVHDTKELVKSGRRSTSVQNASMTTHFLSVRNDRIPMRNHP